MRKLLLTLAIALVLPLPAQAQYRSVRVQVLDRGQADGILIRTPNQQWIVIDAGTNAQQAALMDQMEIERVALAVVSHRHFDHHGGMDEVLRDFWIERFAGVMEDCPNRTSDDRWRAVVDSKNIPVESIPGSVEIDGVRFRFLPLPSRSPCPNQENNNSVVVRLDYGDFSMLFTGDAEVEELEWLLANHRDLLQADVLKASHHGSHNGRTDEFLEAVDPAHVVISAGVNDTYGHPHREAVEDYEEATDGRVFCTNRHGTIRVYGYPDGRVRVRRQFSSEKSCVYDGTHY